MQYKIANDILFWADR